MKYYEKADNHPAISNKLSTARLEQLEKRALRKKHYFAGRTKVLRKQLKRVVSSLASRNLERKIEATENRLNYWTKRLDSIHDLLTERMLLTKTESK